MSAGLTLQTSIAVALITGLCGYFWRPVAVAPACVCRCSIPDPDEARLGRILADSSSTVDREPRRAYTLDTTVSLVWGVFLGFVLGVTFAVAVAKFWNCLITALSQALEPQPSLRRPRALAP